MSENVIDLTENQLMLFLASNPDLKVSIRYSEGDRAGCGFYTLFMNRKDQDFVVKREVNEPLYEDLLSDILVEMRDVIDLRGLLHG